MKFPGITLDEIMAIRAKRNKKYFHTLMLYSYLTHQYEDNMTLSIIQRPANQDIIYIGNFDIISDDDIFVSDNIVKCFYAYSNKFNMNEYIHYTSI